RCARRRSRPPAPAPRPLRPTPPLCVPVAWRYFLSDPCLGVVETRTAESCPGRRLIRARA
ncbi:hypothetical protein HMPREF0175_1578, partial [Bifidobacterium longum subsp. longum ATCC 55813]